MKRSIQPYFIKYKRLLIPLVFGILAVFIVFVIILPQISSVFNLSEDISAVQGRIQVLKDSLIVVSSQDDGQLDSKVSTATNALPTSKDIIRIFTALNSAAAASGTSLREFSLDVGGIYGRAVGLASGETVAPTVEVLARVEGSGARDLSNFPVELSRKFPLSQISKISESGDTASFQIGFFYKPVDISIIAKKDKVTPLNEKDSQLLDQLKEENSQ